MSESETPPAVPASLPPVPASAPAMPEAEGAVCTMRPGDPGFDECEACQ